MERRSTGTKRRKLGQEYDVPLFLFSARSLWDRHSSIEICMPRGTRLTPKPDEGFDPVSWISVLPTSPLVAFIEGRGDDGAVHEPPHLLGSRSQFAVYA